MPVTLTVDGHDIETGHATVAPHASASVTFTQFTLAEPAAHGVVRAGTDKLAADNSFDFVLNPSQTVSVLVIVVAFLSQTVIQLLALPVLQ